MNDKDIEELGRQALDESLQSISPATQKKLYDARQTALSSRKRSWFQQPALGWAVAASFSAILLINYIPSEESATNAQIAHTNLDDFMFLSTLDETDLQIAQDLEFAYWLSEQLENENHSQTLSGDVHNG